MRLSASPSSLRRLSAVALLLSTASLVGAKPAIPPNLHLLDVREAVDSVAAKVIPRQDCANPCGFKGWLCCPTGSQCYTDDKGQAQCGAANLAENGGASSGYWKYFTTTWVETESVVTMTAVGSIWVGAPNPTDTSCGVQCGPTCCQQGYYCLVFSAGICAVQGSTPGAGPVSTPPPAGPTSTPPAPTQSATVSPTTTEPFGTAVPTGQVENPGQSSGGGLSGGAIAGIVIGVLAGIFLLLLICLFCCARAIFDSIMAIFGLGKKRHTHEETYIEEHHHSSGGGGRWYGHDRPSKPSKEKKSGGLGGLAGIGAALGALALVLGLKRKHDKRHEKSDYGSSYYSSDYTSSSSASSSDRHTRRTRDSRHTRDTRRSSRRT